MPISKGYIEFLQEKEVKQSFYERACNFSEKIVRIKPSKSLDEKLKDAIEFTRLDIKPSGPLSLGLLLIIFSFLVLIPLFIFQILSFAYVIFVILLAFFFGVYLIYYPIHLSKVYRIKAGSELVLSILYMVIAMRSTPNLENAVVFAGSNLSGIVGKDFRQLLWDVEIRKYDNIDTALREYSKKWREEGEEFLKAIELIVESLYQTEAKRNKMLDEAINVILTGSSERMNRYVRSLTPTLSAIYMMGIMLPVLGLVMFPMFGIFLGEFVNQWILVFGYNIILPVFVFWFIAKALETRPTTFSAVDISEHPEAVNADKFLLKISNRRIYLDSLFVAIIFEVIFFSLALFLLPMPLTHTLYSVMITTIFIISITSGVIIYSYGKYYRLKKIQEEIEIIEKEFTEAIFQLGYRINRGIPLEKALGETVDELKQFKIRGLFEKSLSNIKNLGMTFEESFFDKTYGAIRYYPSRVIKAIMKVISDSSKKGTQIAANAMLTINTYLKGIHLTQERIDDALSETVSSLNFLAYFLVPMMCGIVVALSQLIINVLMVLSTKLQELTNISGLIGFNPIESIVNLQTATTPEMLQMVIGIYMVELSIVFAYFISGVKKGVSPIDTYNLSVKILLAATIVYVVFLFGIGGIFGSIIQLLSTIGV